MISGDASPACGSVKLCLLFHRQTFDDLPCLSLSDIASSFLRICLSLCLLMLAKAHACLSNGRLRVRLQPPGQRRDALRDDAPEGGEQFRRPVPGRHAIELGGGHRQRYPMVVLQDPESVDSMP